MLSLCLLTVAVLGQAPVAPAPHPDIQPRAHANPSEPGAAEFDSPQGLPPGHPDLPAGDAGPEAALSAKEILDRLDAMKAALKGRPKSAEIEFALGNLYYENARWPDAIDSYRQLLERSQGPLERFLRLREKAHLPQINPGDCKFTGGQPTFDALIATAEQLAGREDTRGALACYQAALLPLSVALTRQGNAWFLIGNEDKAIAAHERALEIVPGSPDNLFFLGAILFESGDGDVPRLKRAKDYWQRFLRAHPDPDREKMVSKDILRVQMAIDNHGHVPAEMPPQMRAMAVGPIAPPPPAPRITEEQRAALSVAEARGETALAAKHWEAALEAFEQARKMDRGEVRAARGSGIALLNLGKLIEAEGALRDALGRDPNDSLALYELGEVFFKGQHYAGAARFWSQVLEEDPKLGEELKIQGRLQAAQQAE